jgi:hypothetical protein
MRLVGANPNAKVVGLDPLPGKSNYFIGNDPKKWRTNVSQYAKVKYEGIYSGIDLVYYGNPSAEGRVEYDFIVAPGADPKAIRLALTPSPSPAGRGEQFSALQPSPSGRGWSDLIGPGEGAPPRAWKDSLPA